MLYLWFSNSSKKCAIMQVNLLFRVCIFDIEIPSIRGIPMSKNTVKFGDSCDNINTVIV